MSVGSSIIGIHHASRMFPSIAPMRMAILSPSPVFVSTATVCVHGPRRNARLSSSLCSKPPVAITTLAARTSLRPSGVSKTTPATSPSSMISSTARWLVCGSTPRSRQAFSRRPPSASPMPRSSLAARRCISSGVSSSGTAWPSVVSPIVRW